MSASLIKKSLKLFEEEDKNIAKKKSGHRNTAKSARASSSKVRKQQPTLKDKKVKSALDAFVQKHRKVDKTEENLAVLAKISDKKALNQASAEKIISYHLKKHRKVVEAEQKTKEESTVFTEEDFSKFEREYFVKA